MDNKSFKNQNLIFNSSYFVFIFSIVYLIGIAIELKIGLFLQLIIVLLITVLVKYIINNPFIFSISLSISFFIALLINHYITPFIYSFMDRVYNLLVNIIGNLKGHEQILEENTLIFWIMITFIFSLYTSLILFKSKKIFLLIPVYFSFYLYYWYYFYNQAYWMISIFLLAYFILMAINRYNKELVKSTNKKEFERLYFPWIRTTASYSVLIILLSILIPKSSNYIKWPWLQNKVYTAFPEIAELRSSNIYSREYGGARLFDFTTTGFQESLSRLGGPVNLSNKKIMTVHASDINYLRGNIKHRYTGYSWEFVNVEKDNYTLRQDLSGISDDEKSDFFEVRDIVVTNHIFASTTIFSPYLPQFVNTVENSWVSVNKDYSLSMSRGIYDSESYFVRTLKPLPYGVLMALGADYKKSDIEDLNIYLQLPERKITERTKVLTKEIVKDKNSDYEKAKAIEEFLRDNYKYNLKVGEVPEGVDFVDYFLFEEGEGYCTYFASSMAIMLRLEGIPARYIEGFLANKMVEPNIYEVSYENAHAWVEAFIEPVGWMTFEATPVYPIEDRMEGYIPPEANDNTSTSNEYKDFLQSGRNLYEQEVEVHLEIGIGESDTEDQRTYEKVNNLSKNTLLILSGILLSIIPFRFITGLIKIKTTYSRFKKLPNNKRIIYLYDQILKLISALDYPQENGETHFEYAQRIAYKFYDHQKVGIKEITEMFVKAKYGNQLVSDEDVQVFEVYKYDMEKRLKNHIGRRAYYFKKYFYRVWL